MLYMYEIAYAPNIKFYFLVRRNCSSGSYYCPTKVKG